MTIVVYQRKKNGEITLGNAFLVGESVATWLITNLRDGEVIILNTIELNTMIDAETFRKYSEPMVITPDDIEKLSLL